jgi:hypothetical protein
VVAVDFWAASVILWDCALWGELADFNFLLFLQESVHLRLQWALDADKV